MEKITQEQLNSLLRKHKLYLKGYECGKYLNLREADLREADLKKADLRGADLREADLREADLRGADLREADLREADLKKADLREADLRGADLRGADLKKADLREADLWKADLSRADLRWADLREADLSEADLREADLSQTKGLLSAIDYLEENFEKTSDGYIVYKVFNLYHKMPSNWKIEKNFILKENVDNDRFNACSYGINIGTLKFIKNETLGITNEVYKLLIKYEWLAGVVVPYNTEGNIRCERAMIIEQVIE